MKASTTTATIEPSNVSNRRQPARQARTNPPRNAASATRPFAGRGSLVGQQDDRANPNASPGFFPAITHFTDSITALSKEMIRHYTMLKEVDAKICGPEDTLKRLVITALKAPVPPRKTPTAGRNLETYSRTATRTNPSAAVSVSGLAAPGAPSRDETNSQHGAPTPVDIAEFSRRQHFLQLRMMMGEMLTTLDEKNHVISTSTDALERQLKRCESSFPHIDNEISEETRLGNLRHWAYTDKSAEKKGGTTAGERTRRDAAAANGLAASVSLTQEGELAALRSEARREAVAARKQRAQHVDSDFDDSRTAKKPAAQAKSRKLTEITPVSNGSGLGITNGQASAGGNPPKRRKVEKPVSASLIGGMGMERSLSSVYGTGATAGRGNGGSPRETPAVETSKKRGRGGTITNGTGRRRQVVRNPMSDYPDLFFSNRTGTNASAVNSPLMASSPVVGTFTTAIKGGNSPALGAMQRSQSSRGRQNSSQTIPQESSRSANSSSTTTKHANGHRASIPQLDGASAPLDTRPVKDAPISKPDTLVSTDPARTTSRDRPTLKREAPSPPPRSRADRPPSISTTRTSGKASKNPTPISSSFPEPTRPRSGRTQEPTIKRSHKKGAGMLAQQQLLAAQQAAQEEEIEGSGGEEDEEGEGEPLYCYCNGVSYGEMVACDFEGCEREWFHLECAGLARAPTGKSKWYCDDCKKKLKA